MLRTAQVLKTKFCKQCKKKYVATSLSFYAHKNNTDGLYSTCKRCCRDNSKKRKEPSGFKPMTEEEKKIRVRETSLFNTYGITLDDYNAMFEKQKGCCAICGKHQTELSHVLYVEHNHSTGNIRGLTCSRCNKLIDVYEKDFYGFKEDIADYLRRDNG